MPHKTESYSLARRDDAAKREFWSCLALRECPGIGMRRISLLLGHFGSAHEAVRGLAAWPGAGVPAACAREFGKETWRRKAYLEWVAAGTSPCGIVLWADAEYPEWLRAIPDAPPFLYFFGELALLKNPSVAVVGMRSCSEEGLKAAVHITRGLAKAGLSIVSGMAKGIDRAAHLAALDGVGSSIGVLGAGIDVVYPAGNGDLYALMRRKGLLVSEMPPGFGVDGRCFPIRNRIISGLARAVVVVEAAMHSGSLNTAKHALEQNREVMAVPGPVSASSAKGCQELIRRGAKPVFHADDVLRELVGILPEATAKEVLTREAARFQTRGRKKEAAARPRTAPDAVLPRQTAPEAGLPGLPEAVLPWRAAPAKKPPEPDSGATARAASPDVAAAELAGLDAAVYGLVRQGPIHIDDICRSLGQSAPVVSSVTAMLEVRGFVTRLPGMLYAARQ
ncbi:MAG: DNA-processing protein DprA [Deltaproteobacteria bacterium]|jgi:DNA processing protein|nr:DNA-processing protein DprA [Deltaproteobacteria bacterium]